MQNIHVVVATGIWEQDQLRYRRHRLADYLQGQPETREVIWLCPSPDQSTAGFSVLKNGVHQYAVADLLPQKVFRFGRFLDLFYEKKLQTLRSRLETLAGHYRFYLWYTCPLFPAALDLFPWEKVIYDCSDLWAAPIGGNMSPAYRMRKLLISRSEQRIIDRADLIFCTSDYLRNQMTQKIQLEKYARVHTYENGVDYDLFDDTTQAGHILPDHFSGTVLGYIGGLKPKLDFQLIRETASRKPDWFILLVGPDGTNKDSQFQELLQEKNVLWTGSVAPADVPKYMNLIDIGIMPYKPSPYNDAVFPLKLFEFLAAGKAAVGVHLPSTRVYSQKFIYAQLDTSDPDTFISTCEQMEKVKGREDIKMERKSTARRKDWNEIFRKMTDLI